MLALQNMIPDADTFLALSPEELAAKLLFALRQIPRAENNGMFTASGLSSQFGSRDQHIQNNYPTARIPELKEAFFEAWAWLESQALLIWPDGNSGANGWRKLSRRASGFEDERQFLAFATGKELRPELLHPAIGRDVYLDFARGDFGIAIFRAMREVEIVVRAKSGLAQNIFGVDLMRRAFNTENGPLTDLSEAAAEREALSALFAGAIGRFKNPHSHRNVSAQDARDAIEIILLANHLLKILDTRQARP